MKATPKYQNWTIVKIRPAKTESTKDVAVAAYADLINSGLKLSAKQRAEVETWLKTVR